MRLCVVDRVIFHDVERHCRLERRLGGLDDFKLFDGGCVQLHFGKRFGKRFGGWRGDFGGVRDRLGGLGGDGHRGGRSDRDRQAGMRLGRFSVSGCHGVRRLPDDWIGDGFDEG